MLFIGCGSQPRNTIQSFEREARWTWDSMPCSLESTSFHPLRL